MKKSKFCHVISLQNHIYAIYNSLIMDVVYVTEDMLQKIQNMNLTSEEIKPLKEKGILIETDIQDEEALDAVKRRYDEVTGRIQIMYLILSSSCNLACKYCFIENSCFNNKKEIMMSEDTAKRSIEKYAAYLTEHNMEEGLVILYGGEPLVNWKVIQEILPFAKKLCSKIKFSMVTNATLLDIEKIQFLSKYNVEIGISIDGPKSLNDRNRIYHSSNKSVYDNVIDKFPKLDICNCKYGLSITVSEDLLLHQDEVLFWLKKLGVHSIFYNLYHFTSYSDTWEDYYKRASAFLVKSYHELSPNHIYDGRLQRKLDSILENEFKFADCGAVGGNQITIKPNGDICICHAYFKTDKYVIGNINCNSIDEVTNTDEMKFWQQRNTLNNATCLSCEALFSCGGGCVAQAEALFQDRNSIDFPFCIHTKTSLQWVLQTGYNLMIEDHVKEVV